MSPDYSRFLPWVFALLVPLMLYRRFKRTFGRQPLVPARLIVRIVIFLVIAVLLTASARHFALQALGGLVVGVALALWGASRTRFESADGRRYYVPHTYTGIAVSLLFVGRLVYRLAQSSGALSAADGDTAPTAAPVATMRSPLTMAIFFVLIGYYVCYYSWVLWKSRHITPADLEVPPDNRDLARDDGQKRENQEAGSHE
jgi:cytochrome b561